VSRCGILNILQPYRPSRPVTGIFLLYLTCKTLLLRKREDICAVMEVRPSITAGSQMAVGMSALLAGRLLLPGIFLVIISVRGGVEPRAVVRLEGLGHGKNPITSSGMETATLRLVAWRVPLKGGGGSVSSCGKRFQQAADKALWAGHSREQILDHSAHTQPHYTLSLFGSPIYKLPKGTEWGICCSSLSLMQMIQLGKY
jgi:hypothetical protein